MHTANGLKPMGGGPVSTTSTVDPRRPYCRIMDDAAVVRSSTLPNPVRNAMSTVGDLDKRQLVERCVVITKQPDGYGLTVTGENPVFVDYVKPEGAAFFAGVRQGDRILKVNGMPVSRSNHHEVVRMISDGQNVVLALLGKPTDYSTTPHAANGQTAIMTQGAYDYEIPNSTEDIRRRQIDKLNEMLRTERSYIEEHQNPVIVEPVKSWVDSGGMHYIPAADVGFMGDVSEEDDNEIHHHNNFDQSSFMNLEELKSRPAHLASFINFLLNNSNPSSLLFHLITDAYQSANSPVKELRRFAYEIFSTFLIPNAPLAMANISQPLIQAMDKILKATVNATDQNVDQLRKIFVPARTRALDDINECLADFRQKRQYGPDANQLDNITKGDHAMEYRVSEQMLMKTLETLYNSTNGDLENCEARLLALIMSVATVIKVTLGMRPNLSAWEKLLEKCPTFLTNSKSSVFKMKPMISKRVVQIKGHHFVLNPVNLTVHCYQCRDPVWGVNAQAYFCQNCDVSVHKQCAAQLTDHCYPATQQKNKSSVSKNSKKPFTSSASNLLGGSNSSHSRHESPSTSSTIDNLRAVGATSQPILAGGTVTLGHLDRSTPELRSIIPPPVPSSSVPPPPPQVPPPWGTAMAAPPTNVVENAKSTSSDSGIGTEAEIVRQPSRGKSTPTPWNAAEQLGPPPDEAYEEPISSSFRRVDIVMDERPPSLLRAVELGSVSGSSSLSQHSGNEEETRRMLERVMQTALAEGDSDLEVETEVPALESIISWEIIRHLKPKEKKRQEVVNELFHTERTHVRNLKIIARVFYKPLLLKQIVSADIIRLIFSNLEDVLDIHMEIWHKMKLAIEMWQRDPAQNGLYGEIGELIEGCFQGSSGDRLMRATAMFCQNQQFALDYLRKYYGRSKDDPFSAFLIEAESNPLCRKLQLKDMLPMEMQRLVKYPMLLETIAKYTKDPSTEQTQLLNSVNCAKRILAAVNTAKRNTENHRRLDELQRRVDTTNFDSNDQLDAFLQSFDFTKHQLIYEGSLTWRISRTKMVDFHVVLLEHLIVFLTKTESGKLQLRTQDVDTTFTPLLNLAHFAVTCKSTDKRLFSLFRRHDLRVFEFIAPTVTERKTWQRLIEAQIRACPQADDRSYELPFSTSMTSMPYPSLPTTEEKKIERVHVVTHPRLVSANEITIVQPTVFEHAQPVLTPNERLRRHDKLIMDALIDKQKILASFMGDGKDMEELNNMADTLATLSVGELKLKSSKELAMSAIVQGNRLLDLINKEMNPKKDVDDKSALNHAEHLPSVPCYRLTAISAQLMNHLMALLQVIQDQTSEMTAVRQQLHHFKDMAGPGVRTVSEETLTEPPPLPPPLPPST
uniref:PDZ domain-containing protein n=1 Tax=Panagrellus redivivus TaxID=6233 RepID=A0A7E4VJE1_PANRE